MPSNYNDENLPPEEQLQRAHEKAELISKMRKEAAELLATADEMEQEGAPVLKKRGRKRGSNSIRKISASQGQLKLGKRIAYSDQHKFEINKEHREAIRASLKGHFHYGCEKFGVPEKKFGKMDLKRFGKGAKDWPIQALFKTSKPEEYLVLYEGWASNTGCYQSFEELEKTAPEMIRKCEERDSIIQAIENHVGKSLQQNICQLMKKPSSAFWILEDLTYFQSQFRGEERHDLVIYLSSQLNVRNVPNFILTNRTLVDRNGGKQIVRNNRHAQHITELMKEFKSRISCDPQFNAGVCSSCKCGIRSLIYQSAKSEVQMAARATYLEDGRLDCRRMRSDKRKYIIECSDACGCDHRCPNRTIQKGQSIPLVVYYEDHEKGNVVRAGADIRRGTFLSEYTGVIRPVGELQNDRYSLETNLLFDNCVLDAIEKGNVSRFYSHSCDPNATCIEAHSRAYEEQPLIPRVGIFAIRNIKKGDEITISYYDPDILEAAAKGRTSRLPCWCKADNCNKWIPTSKFS